MSEQAATESPLSGEDIANLIGGAEPEWRPSAAVEGDDPGDENDAEAAEDEGGEAAEAEEPEAEETEAEAAPAEEKAEAKAEAAPEVSPEVAALREEFETTKAQLELQKAHNSRLAGQIGTLRKQLSKRPAAEAEAEGEDEDRVTKLERRFEDAESRTAQEAVQAAIIHQIEIANARSETAALLEEIKKVAPSFKADFEAAAEETDPARAGRLTDLALKAMYAEAKALKNREAKKSAEAVRDRTKTRVAAAKRAAAPTGRATTAANKVAAAPASDDPDAIAAAYRKSGRPGW